MNIQILPYLFKKIGLFLFIFGPASFLLIGFYEGITNPFDSNENREILKPAYWMYLLEGLSLGGIIVYLLSKEKVEDELIKKLRLEAMSLAFLLTVGVLLLLHLYFYSGEANINASLLFYLQLVLFLMIYHYKKRNFSL